MKTTELFVEQVIIGLLVLVIIAMMFPGIVPDAEPKLVGDVAWTDPGNDLLAFVRKVDLGEAGAIIAVAYLVGIIYDRFSDTLLQDLEAKQRNLVGIKNVPKSNASPLAIWAWQKDVFPDDQYRINLFKNGESANEHAHYLRTRMRLMRGLVTLVPAGTVALTIIFGFKMEGCEWNFFCNNARWFVAGFYAMAFVAKLTGLTEQSKTYDLPENPDELKRYAELTERGRTIKVTYFLIVCETGFLLAALLLAFSYAASRLAAGALVLHAGGFIFMLLVAWVWWRISKTYLKLHADFTKFAG